MNCEKPWCTSAQDNKCKTLPKQNSRNAQRRKKNHCLLGEKILIISIKERQCIHKDNISMKACTRVWGSAVQSTNQSLEWQWMGCNTYCDTCPGIREPSSSVSSWMHHCTPWRCLQVTHTQLRPPVSPPGTADYCIGKEPATVFLSISGMGKEMYSGTYWFIEVANFICQNTSVALKLKKNEAKPFTRNTEAVSVVTSASPQLSQKKICLVKPTECAKTLDYRSSWDPCFYYVHFTLCWKLNFLFHYKRNTRSSHMIMQNE